MGRKTARRDEELRGSARREKYLSAEQLAFVVCSIRREAIEKDDLLIQRHIRRTSKNVHPSLSYLSYLAKQGDLRREIVAKTFVAITRANPRCLSHARV